MVGRCQRSWSLPLQVPLTAVRRALRANFADWCTCDCRPSSKSSTVAVKTSPSEDKTLRPHGNRGSTARFDRVQRVDATFKPTGTPNIPLHRPSELACADFRRTAVRAPKQVSYATDFVWDSLLPSAPPIAGPPPPQSTASRGSLKFSGRGPIGPRRWSIQQGVNR